MSPLRIVIAGGYPVLLDSLTVLIQTLEEVEVTPVSGEPGAAGSEIEELAPDLVILVHAGPADPSPFRVIEQTRAGGTRSAFIVVACWSMEAGIVEAAFRAGASGFVCREDGADALLASVGAVRTGRPYVSPSVTAHLIRAAVREPAAEPDVHLTPRELEVLRLVGEGHSTRQIAGRLGVSGRTIDTHRAHIMDKLDIHNVAGLVRYAIRQGIAPLEAC